MHLNLPITITEAEGQIILGDVEEATEEALKQMMDYFLIDLVNSDYLRKSEIFQTKNLIKSNKVVSSFSFFIVYILNHSLFQ